MDEKEGDQRDDKTSFRLNTMQCTLRRHRPKVNLLLSPTKLGLIIIFSLLFYSYSYSYSSPPPPVVDQESG